MNQGRRTGKCSVCGNTQRCGGRARRIWRSNRRLNSSSNSNSNRSVFGHRDSDEELRAMASLPHDLLQQLTRLSAIGDASNGVNGGATPPSPVSSSMIRMTSVGSHAVGVNAWRRELRAGKLPVGVGWPKEDVFSSMLLEAMAELDMARFCGRNKQLVDTLVKNVVSLYQKYLEAVNEQMDEELPSGREGGEDDANNDSMQLRGDSSTASGAGDGDDDGSGTEEDSDDGSDDATEDRGGKSQRRASDMTSNNGNNEVEEEERLLMDEKEIMENIAEEFVKDFKEEWRPSVEAMENTEDLLGSRDQRVLEGFDPSEGLWRKSGWRELEALRKKLANLKELRDLIRSLGRGVGLKGPLQRARAQIQTPKAAIGVVRDEREPSEVRGLTQSADLSRMVPAEMQLIAAARGGLKAAKRLHMVRRAERKLLSYERSGWVEETAKTLDRLEIRPLSDSGPIIVCLDTSSSMAGTREQVAKAVVLEAMRSAHTQQRLCYLYAFSGHLQVQEFQLSFDKAGLERLLDFLMYSFEGGTSVEEVLQLSLQKIQSSGWETSDILLVTDGELPRPEKATLTAIQNASENLGLEVHGVLLGDRLKPMQDICTHLHSFKSWYAVEGL